MKAIYLKSTSLTDRHNNTLAKRLVWGIWLCMVLIALSFVARYGYNIPLAEDWGLVAPFTGHEPNFLQWLWSQNNEHRIPLPRLLMLGLLYLSGGDFRAGMVFNVITLAIAAAALIQVAHHLRGGHTRLVDAFFPLALLHLGHWENLVWSWQLSFVFPTVLIFASLLLFVYQETLAKPLPSILMGCCLVLLPLCGANGLLFIPFLSLWSGYSGIRHWHSPQGKARWPGGVLMGTAAIALLLIALYFIGYQSPTWNPPNPGLLPSLKTSAKFLALGFGPGMKWLWSVGVFIIFALLIPTIGLLGQAIFQQKKAERHRAIGLGLFLGNLLCVAFVMGWGRAALVPQVGLPMRYVLLSVPTLLLIFFVWELYSPKFRRLVQMALLVVLCLLLPLNTVAGLQWRNWYVEGMTAVEQDLADGKSDRELANSHRAFLVHWWDEAKLAEHMQLLREAGITSFAKTKV